MYRGKGLRGIVRGDSCEGGHPKGALVLSGAAVEYQEQGPKQENEDEGDLETGVLHARGLAD